MSKENKIEIVKESMNNDIFELIKREGFLFLKSDKDTKHPMMASFKENGIQNKIIVMPSYIPYTSALWLLRYMVASYLLSNEKDLYLTIDETYEFNEEVLNVIGIFEKENYGPKRNK